MKKLYLILVLFLSLNAVASKIQNPILNNQRNTDTTLFVDDALQFIKVKNTNSLSEYDIMLGRRLEIKKHYADYLSIVDAIVLSSIDNGAVFEEKNSYFKSFTDEKLAFIASFTDFQLEIIQIKNEEKMEETQVEVFFKSQFEKDYFIKGYVYYDLKSLFNFLPSGPVMISPG